MSKKVLFGGLIIALWAFVMWTVRVQLAASFTSGSALGTPLAPVTTSEIEMTDDQRITDFIATPSGLAFLICNRTRSQTHSVVVTDFHGVEQNRFTLPQRPGLPRRLRFDPQIGFFVLYNQLSDSLPEDVVGLNDRGEMVSTITVPHHISEIEIVGDSLIALNSEGLFPISGTLQRSASPFYYGRVLEHFRAVPLSSTALVVADLVEGSISLIDMISRQFKTTFLHAPEIVRRPLLPNRPPVPPVLRPTLAVSPEGQLFCIINKFQFASGVVVLGLSTDGVVRQSLRSLLPRFEDQRIQGNPSGHLLPPYYLAVTDEYLYLASSRRVTSYMLKQ